MKKIHATGFMVFLTFAALCTALWAKEAKDISIYKQAQSFFDTAASLFDKKDLEALVKTAVPGATLRYADGKEVTIEEWKSNMEKMLAGVASMKSKFVVEKVVSTADTMVVTYKETHDYVNIGEKNHRYRIVSRFSATLTKTPEGLKVTRFVQFSGNRTRDGKVLK
ncbi:MAG: hypothetical protein AB9866_20025 [Syntrophobacteraceae bacterium]